MIDLHADAHVDRQIVRDEQQHHDRDERRAEDLHHRGVVAAEQPDHDDDERDGQRHAGDRGQALAPEFARCRTAPSPVRARRPSGVLSLPPAISALLP